jgi:hypothetical protein
MFPPPNPDDAVLIHIVEPWPDHWLATVCDPPVVFADETTALQFVGAF